MYSELNKDGILSKDILQTSGQEKPDNTADVKTHSKRASKSRKFVATRGSWYYQTKSKRSEHW